VSQQHVSDWTPPGALPLRALGSCANALVSTWSKRWFADSDLVVSRIATSGRAFQLAKADDGASLRRRKGGTTATVPGHQRDTIWRAALDVPADDVVSENDSLVLDRFLTEVVDDLLAELENVLGSDSGAGRGNDGLSFVIQDERGRELVSLTLSASARKVMIAKALGDPRRGPKLERRLTALADSVIALEARPGTAVLGLPAIGSLAIGDVIVLDRKIEDGVELGVAGGPAFAVGELVLDDGGAQLHVKAPL